jgi:hypothetical protein
VNGLQAFDQPRDLSSGLPCLRKQLLVSRHAGSFQASSSLNQAGMKTISNCVTLLQQQHVSFFQPRYQDNNFAMVAGEFK